MMARGLLRSIIGVVTVLIVIAAVAVPALSSIGTEEYESDVKGLDLSYCGPETSGDLVFESSRVQVGSSRVPYNDLKPYGGVIALSDTFVVYYDQNTSMATVESLVDSTVITQSPPASFTIRDNAIYYLEYWGPTDLIMTANWVLMYEFWEDDADYIMFNPPDVVPSGMLDNMLALSNTESGWILGEGFSDGKVRTAQGGGGTVSTSNLNITGGMTEDEGMVSIESAIACSNGDDTIEFGILLGKPSGSYYISGYDENIRSLVGIVPVLLMAGVVVASVAAFLTYKLKES